MQAIPLLPGTTLGCGAQLLKQRDNLPFTFTYCFENTCQDCIPLHTTREKHRVYYQSSVWYHDCVDCQGCRIMCAAAYDGNSVEGTIPEFSFSLMQPLLGRLGFPGGEILQLGVQCWRDLPQLLMVAVTYKGHFFGPVYNWTWYN